MGGERDLDTVALIGHHDAAASIECYAHGAIELGLCRLRRVRHTDAASYLCVCVCVCVGVWLMNWLEFFEIEDDRSNDRYPRTQDKIMISFSRP